MPPSHDVHSDAPVELLYVPAAHGRASVAPVAHDEPAKQSVHSLAAARLVELEKVPATHGSAALAPMGQYEPATHATHAVEPDSPCCVPPAHAVHVGLLVDAANEPAAQSTGGAPPPAHEDPAGQSKQ